MLYLFVDYFRDTINASGLLGPLSVLRYIEFRAVLSVILSFALVVLAAPRTIDWLKRKKIGDIADFGRADVNELMKAKSNCLLYTSPSPRDRTRSRMPSSA